MRDLQELAGKKIERIELPRGTDSLYILFEGGEKLLVTADPGDVMDPLKLKIFEKPDPSGTDV